MDKEAAKQAAEFAREEGQRALERAVEWTARSGPQSGVGDLVQAGALFAAAAELDKQAK